MANELDKTIEELEAEVLSELEEANGADAPMKSAGKPDKVSTSGEIQVHIESRCKGERSRWRCTTKESR